MNFQILEKFFARKVHAHDDLASQELLHAQIKGELIEKSDLGHGHNDTYYTEGETDALLAGKADVVHNHDGRYYTESELDNGQLDNRYYTEDETDALLAGLSANVQCFQAFKSNTQNIPAGSFTVVTWEVLGFEKGQHGLQLANNGHFESEDNTGLWMHNVNFTLTTASSVTARVRYDNTLTIAANQAPAGSTFLNLVWGWVNLPKDKLITIEIFTPGATTINNTLALTAWHAWRIAPP